jgi:hypothetical protein
MTGGVSFRVDRSFEYEAVWCQEMFPWPTIGKFR